MRHNGMGPWRGTKIGSLSRLAAMIWLSTSAAAVAQNFWQPTGGPLGGEVRALVVNSAGNIFAGHAGSGVYRSSDNGATWTAANNGLTNGIVNGLALNANDQLFAATFDGVFRSTDNGDSWAQINLGLANKRVRALAINSAGDVFAGTEGGVFRSTNNGSNWTEISAGLTDVFIQALAINNATGDVFVGTSAGGVLRSANGSAWRPFNSGLTDPSVRSLTINGQGNIFAGTNSGIFRLLSTTATWTPINTGLTNLFISSLFIHSNGNIFAGTEGGAFRSTDNGNNWAAANTGLTIAIVNAFANNASGNIFAGTAGGVFRSTNNGANWTEINAGLLTSDVSALAVKSGLVFAGSRAGQVFRSKDGGASWTLASGGLANATVQSIQALAVSSTTGDIFTGTAGGGVYRSSDDGNTWTPINNGLAEMNILSLASNASGHIFAGGASDGIARSTDSGNNWTDINNGLTNTNIRSLAINASDHLFAATSAGVFRSTTNGENWAAVNTGIPGQTPIDALVINANGDIYAGAFRGIVYRSTNNGGSWIAANSGLPASTIEALAANAAGHVFAGTSADGVHRTTDNGGKWGAINAGLTPKLIPTLAVDAGGFIFAGTVAGGVFRSVKSTAPPAVSFSSANINFGAILVGSNLDQVLTVTNSGNADLTIRRVDLLGAAAADFAILSGGAAGTLAPAASRNMTLRFSPATTGGKIASLVITSDAASSPDTIALRGAGIAPALSLSRADVDFGVVWISANANQTLAMTNNGGADLHIASAAIAGQNTGDFAIASGGGALTLTPSMSTNLTIRFAPQLEGDRTATLIITSDAASSPDTVLLRGSGSILSVQADSNEPAAGSSVGISVVAPPNFQPTSRWLFYRAAGLVRYDSTQINQISNGFQGSIPSALVTLRGVEYYVQLSDGQTVVTFPPANARNRPQTIRVRVQEHQSPLTFEPSTYKMISVPVDLDTADFAHTLEEYAEYDTLLWRLFRWQNDEYAEHADITAAFTPGTAFWLITRGGDGFGINDGLSVDSAQPFAIILQPGWNQIANPFAFPVAWDSVKASGPVDTLAYWNGVEYQYDATIMEPWEGYFVKNLANAPVTLTIPPLDASNGINKASSKRQLAANEYQLQLSAQLIGAKLVDTQNFVGLRNRAQIGRDALDFAEAPAIGDYIQLSIIENNERFAGNFKPVGGDGQQWDVELRAHLRANVAKKLQITLQENGQLPEAHQLYILDKDYGAILPASGGAFRIDLNEKFPVRRLKVIVGAKTYAASHNEGIPLIPLNYVLEQNYPNPFAAGAESLAGSLHTTIRYQLSRRAPVTIEIRNLLGQKVRTLVNGLQNTGQHAAIWNGLDESGRAAASGLYFYTLKTEEFTATRKLVLTR